jgi:hypothetical protein
LKVFSLYNRNVSRLRAEEDLRLIQLLACADSPEGYRQITERLKSDYGEPVITKRSGIVPMQRDAWERLKALRDNGR